MTTLRNIIVAVAALITVSFGARADEKFYVEYYDGSTFGYILSSKPELTFAGNTIKIAGPEINDSHKMSDVKHIVFSETAGIDEIAPDAFRITFTDNTTVTLEGFAAGGSASLHNLSGLLLNSSTFNQEGTATISLESLAPGVYVIATPEGKSYKIIKR